MNAAAFEAIPLALAIAASPFAIIPVLVLLSSPHARTSGPTYLAGWVLGLLAIVTFAAMLSGLWEGPAEPRTWTAWLRIAVAVGLLGLAAKKWLGRQDPGPPPAWLTSVTTATPGRALRLGVILAVANPKILVLAATAGATVSSEFTVAGLVITVVVAASSVALPVAASLILGERLRPSLERGSAWLGRHNATIVAVVLFIIAIALIAEGITVLL
jgi:threonine/homoserine/homoserine lactone efflux protein